MAYAALANTDYSVGIYTAIFPVFVYLLFGPSHHISFGTNPLTSMIVGKSNPSLFQKSCMWRLCTSCAVMQIVY